MKKLFIILGIIFLTFTFIVTTSKEKILEKYNHTLESVGALRLTSTEKLQGARTFLNNHYTGIYEATYNNYSGEEYIFGSTSLNSIENVHIKIVLENTTGKINITLNQRGKITELCQDQNTCEYDFSLSSGSNYLSLNMNNYTGNIFISLT